MDHSEAVTSSDAPQHRSLNRLKQSQVAYQAERAQQPCAARGPQGLSFHSM